MQYLELILDFIEKHWLALNLVAVALFFGSLIVTIYIVLKLPQNYWIKENYRKPMLLESIVRNLIALVFFVAGFAMLFLPGQGLLTIVIAFLISHVPYKKHMIRYFILKPKVQRGFDYVRKKFDKPGFDWPKSHD